MPDNKPTRPWGGFGYLILITLAFLVAVYLAWPIGHEVGAVFQRLVDAFSKGK